jgi:uncharacterized protein (DUF1800 family)
MPRRLPILPTCLLMLFAFALGPADVRGQLGDDPDEQRRIRELGVGASNNDATKRRRAEPIAAEDDHGPPLTERQRAVHALNRMAFGPRPGQVDQVLEIGVENWMRQQLEPETIDDAYVQDYLDANGKSLAMGMADIFREYRPAYTPYEKDPPTKRERELRQKEQRERNRLRGAVQRELRDSVYHRAVYSPRQFEEVIVAFWREHFSIDQNSNDVAYFANHWEENVLRRFAFGKFEHLLISTARHPAMLFYLDNAVSQKPLTERELSLIDRFKDRRNVPRSVRALERQRGLNENYARELMELHTLGVDREYTQRDVTELARVFTGWTARWRGGMTDRNRADNEDAYGFFFNEKVHDTRDKVVLGSHLRGGGEEQGLRVLRALADHKYTADFISRKLCAYLLRDRPSEDLVKEVTKVFRRTDGDLKQVYEAILFSDDFFYRQNHRVKFKTPFEYVVSTLRATGAEVTEYREIDRALMLMGQKTYGCPDPTGWYDTAEAWLDPGVLVYRWTFALDLAGNRISGVRVPDALLANLPGDKLKKKLQMTVLPAGLSDRTRTIIDEELGKNPSAQELLAILIGSPDFQQQ